MSRIESEVRDTVEKIKSQLPERAVRVSNALHNSVFNVMQGGVSAPGEPPGVRTGNYRTSFRASAENGAATYISKIESDCEYGPYLEYGTSKMAARPHCDRIAEDALPQAVEIYSEPYD